MQVGIYYEHNKSLVGVEVDETTHTVVDRHETSVVGLSDQSDAVIQKSLVDFENWLIAKMKAGRPVCWQLPQLSTDAAIPGRQAGYLKSERTTVELQKIEDRHKGHPIKIKRQLTLSEDQKNIVRITFLRKYDADLRAILVAYDAIGKTLKGKNGLLKAFEGTPQYQQARLLISTFATDAHKAEFTFANYVNTINRFESSNKNVANLKTELGAKLKAFQDHVDQVKLALGL